MALGLALGLGVVRLPTDSTPNFIPPNLGLKFNFALNSMYIGMA
jgi:hypothetical protein